MKPFPLWMIVDGRRDPQAAVVTKAVREMPVGLFSCAARQSLVLPGEDTALRIAGWSFGKPKARLAVLPTIAIAGCTLWLMLPQASDAESLTAASPPEVSRLSQDSAAAANPATAAAPADIAPAETMAPPGSPLDGLKIVSQSWRRGGLGSRALVTFTLRNASEYAVKDIEIACTFTRRDGRHLTDRRRVIPDTVNMKSRKRYAGVLVGFVNVNANKAKCSLVTASRI